MHVSVLFVTVTHALTIVSICQRTTVSWAGTSFCWKSSTLPQIITQNCLESGWAGSKERLPSKLSMRVQLFQGSQARIRSNWYLGIAESMGHVPQMSQFQNWDLIENSKTLAVPQSSNWHSEKPVQGLFLYFCHDIHNLFLIFFVCSSKTGVVSHAIHTHVSVTDSLFPSWLTWVWICTQRFMYFLALLA